MMAGRTFGNRLAGGFGLTVALTLLMGGTSVAALTVVTGGKDELISRATQDLRGAEQLNSLAESRISDFRAYLLNGTQEFRDLT
ncbi:MAG TPA: methyl-accepting chemotaxis protein, partial [Actinoplanes sp.]|nr:methyl-accepting chemotaxis protein [Actinoplanes sp.]